MKKQLFAVAASLVVAVTTSEAQVVPAGTYSATLPAGVTFGGSGIPGPVMTTVLGSGPRLTIGASPRFSAPALGDNGAGTYTATGGIGQASPLRSLWNFNFAVTEVVTGMEATYGIFWDYENGAGTVNHNGFFFNAAAAGAQDSYNLGFNFIDIVPPLDYDPNAPGEFTFFLAAFNYSSAVPNYPSLTSPYFAGIDPNLLPDQLGHVAMQVNVVPEPSTYALMALGLGALGVLARRRRGVVSIA